MPWVECLAAVEWCLSMANIIGKNPNRPRTALKVVIITVLLVLTGLAGALTPLAINYFKQQGEQKRAEQLETKRTEAQDLRMAGNTDEANKKIDDALKDTSLTDKEKYDLYLEQGNIPFDKQDYAAAIVIYEKAKALSDTFEVNQILALAYRYAGNNDKAIETYKHAIQLIPEDLPIRESRKADLEEYIRQLGGTPWGRELLREYF